MPSDPAATFAAFLADVPASAPILVMGHNDADGLAATAIFARALRQHGRTVALRTLGRGENPWSAEVRADLAAATIGGLIVTDLGVREGALASLGTPTLLVDHHIPTGTPGDARIVTGFGQEPQPTSALLAFRCVQALGNVDSLLWLAALGLIGDMAEKAGFPEMAAARARWPVTALREAVALVNAPRRSAAGDAGPALALLLKADGPKAVLSDTDPDAAALRAAREEVKTALEAAKRIGPTVRNGVALIRLHSPCQIHPLVAQSWRGRLRGEIVLAANSGYRPGWVHFAARTARDLDLTAFLAEHAPPGADENYGSGHAAASGGALRLPDWQHFISGLGFAEATA